jgi:hypothetical protein
MAKVAPVLLSELSILIIRGVKLVFHGALARDPETPPPCVVDR